MIRVFFDPYAACSREVFLVFCHRTDCCDREYSIEWEKGVQVSIELLEGRKSPVSSATDHFKNGISVLFHFINWK